VTVQSFRLPKNVQATMRTACTLLMVCCAAMCVARLTSVAQAQPSSWETGPVAVISINSIDNILEDMNFVGSLAGQPKLGDEYQPMLAGFAPGLDGSKPIGLIVNVGEMGPSGALCVPVTDLKQLVDNLPLPGVSAEEEPDGTLVISVQGQPFFAREAGGWTFVSMSPEMLEGVPEDPSKIIGALTQDYDIGVRLSVQNVPEHFRDMAVAQLQMGMEAGLQQQGEETDAQFAARRELSQVQIEQVKVAINELDELTFGLALDGEKLRSYFDIVYTAVPGSKLAEKIALNSDPKTNFAGFFQPDAAMMLSFASKTSESDVAQVEQMFEAVRKQLGAAIDKEADTASDEERALIKSAMNDFLDAFLSTLQKGVMDGGAVLNLSPSSATLIAGGLVGDPSKVESGLKKLTELAAKKESKFPGVDWDADSHADVKFHTLSIPIPNDKAEPRQLFGDSMEVAVGIGKESAFFALGRDCLEAVKRVIDTSAANPKKSVAPMEMTFALKQIMEVAASLADERDKPNIQMVAEMLANIADGRDHVRIVVQPIPNGARTRIEAEEGVLRAIGMAVMQAQMEAASAGGF